MGRRAIQYSFGGIFDQIDRVAGDDDGCFVVFGQESFEQSGRFGILTIVADE